LKALIASLTLSALFAFAVPAYAATAAPKASPAAVAPVPPSVPDAVTQHTIVLGGKTFPYTARAGTITLNDRAGEPTARMFYVAYTLDGAKAADRPVTFLYNGGPGSSSMWLHMGSIGPVRIDAGAGGTITRPAPYRLVATKTACSTRPT